MDETWMTFSEVKKLSFFRKKAQFLPLHNLINCSKTTMKVKRVKHFACFGKISKQTGIFCLFKQCKFFQLHTFELIPASAEVVENLSTNKCDANYRQKNALKAFLLKSPG